MSKFTRIFAQKRERSRPKTNGIFAKFKINQLKLGITLFILIIASGFAYLGLINNVAARGFEIKDLEKKVENLQLESKKLEIKAAELESIQEITKAKNSLNLVEISKIEYIETTQPTVALTK
jgi:hypothetical protein